MANAFKTQCSAKWVPKLIEDCMGDDDPMQNARHDAGCSANGRCDGTAPDGSILTRSTWTLGAFPRTEDLETATCNRASDQDVHRRATDPTMQAQCRLLSHRGLSPLK